MSNKLRMNTKGLFIVFEGTDGTGKTTCINLLIEKLKSDYGIEVIYNKGIGSKSWLGRLARKFPSTLLFLIELLFGLLRLFKAYYFKQKIIFQDRYFFSIASHVPNINSLFNKMVLSFLGPLIVKLLKPDIIFYFTATPEKQIHRIQSTGEENRFHKLLINHPEILKQREEKLRDLLRPFTPIVFKIDTSNDLPGQTVEKIILLLNKRKVLTNEKK